MSCSLRACLKAAFPGLFLREINGPQFNQALLEGLQITQPSSVGGVVMSAGPPGSSVLWRAQWKLRLFRGLRGNQNGKALLGLYLNSSVLISSKPLLPVAPQRKCSSQSPMRDSTASPGNFRESESEAEGSLELYQIIFYNSLGFSWYTDKKKYLSSTYSLRCLFHYESNSQFSSFCLVYLEQTFMERRLHATHYTGFSSECCFVQSKLRNPNYISWVCTHFFLF